MAENVPYVIYFEPQKIHQLFRIFISRTFEKNRTL